MSEDLMKRLIDYGCVLETRVKEGTEEHYQELGVEYRWEERGKLHANKRALDKFYEIFPDLKPVVKVELDRRKKEELQ